METQPIKENKSSKLDKLVKISIIVGALMVALSVAYWLVVFLPQKERAKMEQQKQEQEIRKECAGWALQEAWYKDNSGYNPKLYDLYLENCLKGGGIQSIKP